MKRAVRTALGRRLFSASERCEVRGMDARGRVARAWFLASYVLDLAFSRVTGERGWYTPEVTR